MSNDGLPTRAVSGARQANADRRAPASPSRLAFLRPLPVAAIAGATAIIFAACSSGAGSSSSVTSFSPATSSEASSGSAEASMAASAEASAASSGGPLAVVFQPINGSQVLGGAVITDQADGTATVEIGIGSTGATDGMPATIQAGSCADLTAGGSAGASGLPTTSGSPSESGAPMASGSTGAGASAPSGSSGAPSGSAEAGSPAPSAVTGPPFQLTPLKGGASTTTIASTTSSLLSSPYAIVLGQSATASAPVACADVTTTSVRVPTASNLPSSLPSLLPSLGTEPSPSSS